MSEVIYELKQPFKYAVKEDMQEASFVTLIAPTYKQMSDMIPIKQAFTAAITEISDGSTKNEAATRDEGEDHSEITGGDVMPIMLSWSGDMVKVMLHSAELFKAGAALVDGESRLTAPLLDKMALEDVEGLVGAYIANFIAQSLMNGE